MAPSTHKIIIYAKGSKENPRYYLRLPHGKDCPVDARLNLNAESNRRLRDYGNVILYQHYYMDDKSWKYNCREIFRSSLKFITQDLHKAATLGMSDPDVESDND